MAGLNNPKRFVAVDWSGDATAAGQRRRIFLASWWRGAITLECGYTREEVCTYLLTAARQTPDLVVGLDFAFSFPAWWLREQGCADAFALWRLAARNGEQWLRDGREPFWGRPRQPRPPHHEAPHWRGHRITDRDLKIAGCSIRPKSPFQIGGAGAVGTGSIRGTPILACLHQAGFHVWPFQPAKLPLVLEVYPRLFTGPVVKSNRDARQLYLRRPRFAGLSGDVLAKAIASEDAFDALCTVLGMLEHKTHLSGLKHPVDEDARLEGVIWDPTD